MITLILGAVALIALLAVAVGIADAAQGPSVRRRAAERRERWEADRPRRYVPSDDDEWDDD